MSNLAFRGMALWLRWRERTLEPKRQLESIGMAEGQVVLDYGCGVGSYSLPAAAIVGRKGQVHALDIHPLAIEAVERRAKKADHHNIRTILSDRNTGLTDNSVDVVLLYDVLHSVTDKKSLLGEVARVLKPGGLLSVKPDHMTGQQLLQIMEAEEAFSLQSQQGGTFGFRKQGTTGNGTGD